MVESARKAKEQPEELFLLDQVVQDFLYEQGPIIREEVFDEGF